MIDRILDCHGGLELWNTLSEIELNMSASGFLFTTKRVPTVDHVRMVLNTREPHVVTHDHPAPGQRTVFDGRVRILDADGAVLRERLDPRAEFPKWRWDALDFAYFSGYAMWNYLTLPFLLRRPGVEVTAHPARPDGLTRLRVTFPPGLPTHCRTQDLTFGADGRLIRHDYTAEVIGGWAKAAHLCSDYRQFNGLWLPTRRRVYPRGPGGRPLPAPTLVAIDIHDARPR